jgi:hypothetical protein
MASNFYRAPDAPRYKLGHGLEIGFISCGIMASLVQITYYKKVNASRAEKVARHQHNGYTLEELSDLGDKAITFKYTL